MTTRTSTPSPSELAAAFPLTPLGEDSPAGLDDVQIDPETGEPIIHAPFDFPMDDVVSPPPAPAARRTRARNPLAVPRETLLPLREVAREAATCTGCALADSRSQVIFGEGHDDAELMIIGLAPGRTEDLLGRPFTGGSGNVLDKALGDAGIDREDAYLTTIVKCMPPDHRDPELSEIEACSHYILEQIGRVRPRVIVTLGQYPTRLILQRDLPIQRISGYRFDVFDGVTLVPTYAPDLALKGNAQAVRALRRDLKMAKGVLDGTLAPAHVANAVRADA